MVLRVELNSGKGTNIHDDTRSDNYTAFETIPRIRRAPCLFETLQWVEVSA